TEPVVDLGVPAPHGDVHAGPPFSRLRVGLPGILDEILPIFGHLHHATTFVTNRRKRTFAPGGRHRTVARTRPADLVFVPTSPCSGDVGPPDGAGLTSKAHRDRSTRSRLTWAVSPAPGIGLPEPRLAWRRRGDAGATTAPRGCRARHANPLCRACPPRALPHPRDPGAEAPVDQRRRVFSALRVKAS